MSDSKIFIPELWEPKIEDKLDNFALKAELNHFILKNTDINMNDHAIENVKNSGNNDAVNKSYVDNAINSVNNLINTVNALINSVQSKIPYMTFIKEIVTGSDTAVKIIQRSIEDPVFNGLKPENVLLIPRVETTSNNIPLNLDAKVVSIHNNIVNFNIRIENRWKQGWEINVVVYVYIFVVHQKTTLSIVQNDEPSNEVDHLDTSNMRSINMAKSYF